MKFSRPHKGMPEPDSASVEAQSMLPSQREKTVAMVLPDLRIGGAERVALNLSSFFLDQGYAVTFVLREKAGGYLEQLDSRARVVDLKAPRIRSVVRPLADYLRHERPAAMLAFMWPLTVVSVASRALARSKTRLVVSEHTTWSRSELVQGAASRLLARLTMNLAFRRADAVVCVSRGAASDLAAFAGIPRGQVHAIYNPIVGTSRSLRAPDSLCEPRLWWSGPHQRVLAVGSLIPLKGFGMLLRSFVEVRKSVDAKLLILGEGPERTELEREARRLQLEDHVFLPGAVNDPTPYYARADLSVMSSEVEGFGNVLVEALACGTPVVSTDCPSGPREILAGGNFGALVPVGDSEALAAAIVHSLRTPSSPEMLRARAAAFSIVAAGQQYEDLLFPQRKVTSFDSPEETVPT